MTDEPEDPVVPRAERFLWDTLRRRLEAAGQGEAAIQLQHHLKALLEDTTERQGITTLRFAMHHRVSDYSVRLDAAGGAVMGWLFDLLGEKSTRDLAPEEAVNRAQEVADVPADAVLAISEYRDLAGDPVFHARWEHRHDGIPVEGDHVHVLVNGRTGRPFSLSRKWHEVRFASGAVPADGEAP